MKKKFDILAIWSFALAVGIFLLAFYVFHYVRPNGAFTLVYQKEAGKPLVSQMLANLGVLFLFSGIMNVLIGNIFFRNNTNKEV